MNAFLYSLFEKIVKKKKRRKKITDRLNNLCNTFPTYEMLEISSMQNLVFPLDFLWKVSDQRYFIFGRSDKKSNKGNHRVKIYVCNI